MAHIRITTVLKKQEDLLKRESSVVLKQWVELSVEDLTYKLTYAKTEETKLYQGALRALNDLLVVLSL
jgi:hypothetical protein